MQLAAVECGHIQPTDAAARDIIGLGLKEAIERLFPEVDELGITAIGDAYRTHWLADDVPHSVLFDGATALIEQLAQNDYLLAVATGKSRRGLDAVFYQCGLGEMFHASRCADEAFSKPHPQMLEDILTDLNTEPHKALVIGDTEYDMQMASNAKVDAIGIVHGVHSEERLVKNGALTVLQQLSELPIWLDNLHKETNT